MESSSLRALKVVRPKRLYEQIAEQIEALIRTHNIPPGSKLPGERELVEALGVSRPSIREALIALETAGYIEFRPGSGNYVRDSAAKSLLSLRRLEDLGPGPLEQFEARRVLESSCAELAAERASLDQIDALKSSLERMKGIVEAGDNPSEEHRRFHSLLAEGSGNSIFATAVADLWTLRQGAMWDLLRRRVDNIESFRAGIRFRTGLIASLKKRDPVGARVSMEQHFARVARLYFDPSDT